MKIQIFFAILTALLMSFGQILFKKASILNLEREGISLISKYITNPWFIFGIFIFGISTLTWMKALSGISLSRIYPFVSLAYIFTFILAYFIFGEKITSSIVLGTLIIVVGLIIIGLGK